MKKIIIPLLAFVVLVAVVTVGASFYMLNFSLSPDPNRTDLDSAQTALRLHEPTRRSTIFTRFATKPTTQKSSISTKPV